MIHDGQLSSKFPILQGSGQGRILAPLMYKVYINSLVRQICDLRVGICLTNRVFSAPTKWRYEYHKEKSGIVVFGETPAMHGRINTRNFVIGCSPIDELKEYNNLGIYKNYCGSFATNIDENVMKARKSQVCYSQPDLIGGGLTL